VPLPTDLKRKDRACERGSPFMTRLIALAEDESRERVFVHDLFQALEGRAMAVLILLFALPNILPVPPGTSALLGAPLLFLTIEWMLGTVVWLPRALANRSIARADFAAMVRRAQPWISRGRKLSKPSLELLVGPLATRLVAALCAILALIILLPIPLGNMPPAWSICLIAIGTLRRDGVWVLLGATAGLASIALIWAVTLPLFNGALCALQRALV